MKYYLHNLSQQTKRLLSLSFLMLVISSSVFAEDRMTLNFSDTDINAVINAVAKLTNKNFIVDPRVKGKVTVITHQSMNKEEVYKVFLSVLKVHGYAAIPGNSVIKIVPEVNAKQDSIPNVSNSYFEDGDGIVTQVIKINNVDAAQLVPILRPLVPQRGHLAAYPASNVIIISDSAANISRISQIIRRIDLTVNDEIEVISLQHASASELVRLINQLNRADPKKKTKYTIVADDRTNSILLGGDRSARLRLRAIISHMDIPVDIGGDAHVIYLRYAKAKDLVSVLTGVSKSLRNPRSKGKKASPQRQANNVSILADEGSNALVINAPPSVFRSLRNVINKLDIKRAQVIVESIIAELSYQKASEFGVQWAADGTSGGRSGPVGLVNFSVGTSLLGVNGASLEAPPSGGLDGLSLGLGSITDGILSMGAMIRALAGDASTNILSTPTLVTLDNQEAEIVVGQNIPFVTGSYSSTGTGGSANPGNPFQTIQRQDVGLTLRIKPQINEGDSIKLEITQEVSSLAASVEGSADLITNKRSIKTNVMVNDDQMIVLGGLIEDALRETEQKVPGFGDIPVIGWLFKYNKQEKQKTNLMVFIHPTILRDEGTIDHYTNEKYNFIRSNQVKLSRKGLSLLSDKEIPLMPESGNIRLLPPRYMPANSVLDLNIARPPEVN
ncbi:General secretion pathway protein D [hydrothermal vent metagenome]|uniref:General secretion pathway protein D n=1 Tax=hydrothermal vent metagenome TaxID=652676 RepID=A0A3B1AZK7_9ZZZZ